MRLLCVLPVTLGESCAGRDLLVGDVVYQRHKGASLPVQVCQ